MGTFFDYNNKGELERRDYRDLGESYLKNYKQGGTPQQAFSVGLRYSSPKYWWISGNWNYFRDSYLDQLRQREQTHLFIILIHRVYLMMVLQKRS